MQHCIVKSTECNGFLVQAATLQNFLIHTSPVSRYGGRPVNRSCDPLELVRLPFGGSEPLYFVLVNPLFEAPTKQMRAVLPRDVPFKSMIHNSTQGGALVAAILQGGC